jgi:hypothetical protein
MFQHFASPFFPNIFSSFFPNAAPPTERPARAVELACGAPPRSQDAERHSRVSSRPARSDRRWRLQPWSSPAAGEAWGGVPAQAWGRRRPTGGAAAARSSGEEAVGVRVARRSNGYCFLHESQTLEDGLGKKFAEGIQDFWFVTLKIS